MGITRRLPISDEDRKAALLKATSKNAATAAGSRHLTASTQTRLGTITTSFINAMQARGVALAAQAAKTDEANSARLTCYQHVSHFFQVFNLGIDRGKYAATERPHFQLPMASAALPPLNTDQEILDWGLNIVSGDAERITAGGTAMSNPTAAEVGTVISAFAAINSDHTVLKDAYDVAQQAVSTLRTEADAVIKKIWDETETYFNEETPESMRRKSREWGVKYVSSTEITFHIAVTDSATNNPVGNVTVTLTDTNNEHPTDAAGHVTIVSTVAVEATFTFEHPDYVPQEKLVELPTGQTSFDINIALVHV